MLRTVGFACLAALACPLGAGAQSAPADSDPPPLKATLNNEVGEVSARPKLQSGGWTFTPDLKAGLLAPGGLVPPILMPSPYFGGAANLAYTGALEFMASATGGYIWMNTRKGIEDPAGAAASPVNQLPTQNQFSQGWLIGSAYLDLGKVVSVGSRFKSAVFAAAENWGVPDANRGFLEGVTGGMAMYHDPKNEATAFGVLRVDQAPDSMFHSYDKTYVPAATAGAEYARTLGPHRIMVGVETSFQRADTGERPYVGWAAGPLSALVAMNIRQSQDSPFYPDVIGGGSQIGFSPANWAKVGLSGFYDREKFANFDAPVEDYRVTTSLTIDIEHLLRLDAGYRIPAGGVHKDYDPAAIARMNGRLPTTPATADFTKSLADSPTLDGFVQSYGATTTDRILSAASNFANGIFNHDTPRYDPTSNPNGQGADDPEQIYARVRTTLLSGGTDPFLVCEGEGQIVSDLVNGLAQKAGLDVHAMAVHLAVPGADGKSENHAAAAISTPEYGIVLDDWGKLVPTHTPSIRQALEVYQAIQGVPDIYSYVTRGPLGEHVGFLFSPEGRLLIRQLTAYAELHPSPLSQMFYDDPRVVDVAVPRWREILHNKFAAEAGSH